MGLIDSYRRTLELTEIEHRLNALEAANALAWTAIAKVRRFSPIFDK
jgi:hypothetical protein